VHDAEDFTAETESAGWPNVVFPVLVLLLVVGVVCLLVFTGVVTPDQVRESPEAIPTTTPTIEISP